MSFIGILVQDGTNHYNDATVAYRRAGLNGIEHLLPAASLAFDVRPSKDGPTTGDGVAAASNG